MKRANTPVYAIIRLDFSIENLSAGGGATPHAGVTVTVKEVVRSQKRAEEEVARLNSLNAQKGCQYFWQCSRLLEDEPQP